MSKYRNTFKSFASGSCAIEDWAEYFVDYNLEEWDKENDGILQFFSDDEKEYQLIVQHWFENGFLLIFSCRNLKNNRSEFYRYSLSEPDKINDFVERDDLQYPVGCFLPAEDAWLAVKDFLSNDPSLPSDKISWIDDEDIEWPF